MDNHVFSSKRKGSKEDAGPSERSRAPHQPQDKSRNSESICDQCSQVDWASVPTLAARGELDICARVLRPINESSSQLAASSCRICRILSLIKSPSLSRRQCFVYAEQLSKKRASSASPVPGSTKVTVLSIAEKYYIQELYEHTRCLVALTRNGDEESCLMPPSSINYDKLKRLARFCEKNHNSTCTAGTLHPVSGLRVIDVSSRMVVEAPRNCRYLALSYVWGQQPDPFTSETLRYPAPLIEDAISVTTALEYDYLWVDRYCITQDNPHEKHHMINQMGQVYANASVTIIAAAGDNSEVGLPGVSMCPRKPQQRVDIQNTTLLEIPYGEDDLLSSKWASRGWTYQEGYLSKRRIIFTPNQVLFLCNDQYLEEYVDLLLKDQGDTPGKGWFKLASIFPTSKLASIFPTSSRTAPLWASDVLLQVQQYSLRELSHSTDSLNAFRGILNYSTTGRIGGLHPITHLGWGLLAEQARAPDALFIHLDWYHQNPAKRRHEFPSWAWTGWGGPLTFGKGILVERKNMKHSFALPHLTWEVSVEAEGEKTMDMCDLASICLTNAQVASAEPHPIFEEPSPRRLLITCRVLPIHFLEVNLTEAQIGQRTEIEIENTMGVMVMFDRPALHNKSLAVLEVWEGIYVGSPYKLDQDLGQKNCVIGLLFLSVDVLDHNIIRIGCLMARLVENGLYERIGLVRDILPFLTDRRARMIFLDEMGGVIDKVKVPQGRMEHVFDEVGERKTICLL